MLDRSPVFADQDLDGISALDPGGQIDRLARFLQRSSLSPGLMGTMLVIVLCILDQDLPQVPFTVVSRWSRHSRRSVPAYRSAKEFARGGRTGDLMIRTPLTANTSSNVLVNLSPRTRIRNLKRSARPPRSSPGPSEVAGLLGDPGPGGAGRDAQDVHAPGSDLQDEEDVQTVEEHGVHVQEVA